MVSKLFGFILYLVFFENSFTCNTKYYIFLLFFSSFFYGKLFFSILVVDVATAVIHLIYFKINLYRFFSA